MEYNIGDRVRVFREPHPWYGYVPPLDRYVGMVGTVVSCGINHLSYRLDFNIPGAHTWNFPAWALMPADEEPDGLNPGDLSRLFCKEKKND